MKILPSHGHAGASWQRWEAGPCRIDVLTSDATDFNS